MQEGFGPLGPSADLLPAHPAITEARICLPRPQKPWPPEAIINGISVFRVPPETDSNLSIGARLGLQEKSVAHYRIRSTLVIGRSRTTEFRTKGD